VVLTLLAIFLIKGRIAPKPTVLAVLVAILFVGAPLLLKGAGLSIDRMIAYEYGGYHDFVSRSIVEGTVEVRSAEYREDLPVVAPDQSRLDRAQASGWLRIGHSPDGLPWAFRNEQGETVGYDMELLHNLAGDLGVGIEIVRLHPSQIGHALASAQIDIYASGLMIDAGLLREFTVSRPYAEITLGSMLPDVEFVTVESPREFLRGKLEGVDALVMSAEAASAWTLVYPQYSAVIPASGRMRIPLVFALPFSDQVFADYIDNWIQASASLGVMERAYQHWILGRDVTTRKQRWSVIRDVLHWVD
jgi:ABC-type amino acid transport substrate-binding protein